MIKPIALYLPQFHPIPENDNWWGKGFTEWTNVTRAKPLYKGHYQPQLPTELGFYDLRVASTRIAQAELARTFGIYGFCYYHYWFNGKRLLHEPLDDMIKTKSPDFPFMICWANENWTRKWDGHDEDVLMKQEYSQQDDLNHIEFLCKHYFSDARYIRVNNKPFISIYRPSLFPDIRQTLKTWRSRARELGFDLHIGFMQAFVFDDNFSEYGFDCGIEFHPTYAKMQSAAEQIPLADKILHKLGLHDSIFYTGKIISYKKYAQLIMRDQSISGQIYPGITPMWDNTARNGKRALIFKDSSPVIYQQWLKSIVEKYKSSPASDQFIFINAWNEWAEGNHLEPCTRWGRQYLEATRAALGSQAVA